jgi:predicted DsbA family dithiol-disulfide isomerase
MPSHPVSITYFLEIQSSWCFWAEPTWSTLQELFDGQVDFSWEIALMPPEAFPTTLEECEQAYRRSGTIMQSDFRLNSGWFEAELQGDYTAANLVAEAGKDFGETGDALRLGLARAALRDGKKIGRLDEAVTVATQCCELDATALKKAALSDTVKRRAEASTRRFTSYQIDQRPAFVLKSAIGDQAVFSGIVHLEPLIASIEAMLKDAKGYASFSAHFPTF